MTKMAAMPIYDKNLYKSSSLELKGRWPWNLVCSIEYSGTTNFVQMMPLDGHWPILWHGQSLVASHFVPRSFRTQVISYLLWLFCTYFFGHFIPSNNHFVPRSFRTHFDHFVPRSTGYEMTIWWTIHTQVISYPFWSFRTHFRHFVPSKDGWIDERTDMRVLIEMTN